MKERVTILYKSSVKNKDFLQEIYNADGDEKPGLFASNTDKTIFATLYYGWLVAKYGNDWKLFL